jgi:hypothetical protein
MRILLCAALAGAALAQSPSAVDAAFAKFWAADSPSAAARAAAGIANSGVSFDEAWRRLKAGRVYAPQSSGVVMLKNRTADGVEHYYAVNVPPNYDPSRRYQVRIQLHGGVGARNRSPAI